MAMKQGHVIISATYFPAPTSTDIQGLSGPGLRINKFELVQQCEKQQWCPAMRRRLSHGQLLFIVFRCLLSSCLELEETSRAQVGLERMPGGTSKTPLIPDTTWRGAVALQARSESRIASTDRSKAHPERAGAPN